MSRSAEPTRVGTMLVDADGYALRRRADGYAVRPRAAIRRGRTIALAPQTRKRSPTYEFLVVVGGFLAVVSFLMLLGTATAYWGDASISEGDASMRFLVFGPLYAIGLFAAAYGWELSDTGRAFFVAMVIGVLGLAILAVLAVVLIAFGKRSGKLAGNVMTDFAGEVVADSAASVDPADVGGFITDLLERVDGPPPPEEDEPHLDWSR